MLDYVLIIVSHKRAQLCYEKTWNLLQRTGAKNIIIWLNESEPEDLKEYRELFPPDTEFRTGGKSLAEKRNIIVNSFPLDTNIVQIDDDISQIVILSGSNKKVVLKDFNKLVELGFSSCKKENCSLWSVYPIDNPLCMNPVIRKNLCYCIGALFGVINKRVTVSLDCAEDYERTIKFWNLEKKVVRLDFIGIATKYYNSSSNGGLASLRAQSRNEIDKSALVKLYPDFCKLVTKKDKLDIKLLGRKDVQEVLVPEF